MDQTVTIMFKGDQKNVVSKNRANIKKCISKNGFEYNLKIKNQYPQKLAEQNVLQWGGGAILAVVMEIPRPGRLGIRRAAHYCSKCY